MKRWTRNIRQLSFMSLMLGVLLLACTPRLETTPQAPRRDTVPKIPVKESYRIVLVGDTGKVGTQSQAVREAILREPKDFILALGDLAYESGPKCPTGRLHEAARRELDQKLGDFFSGLGAPVFLVLGNHGVNQRQIDTTREACLLDYAAEKEELIFPTVSAYSIQLGFLSLVILNTNRFLSQNSVSSYLADLDGQKVAEELSSFQGRTLFAGHHVLKIYHGELPKGKPLGLLASLSIARLSLDSHV